MIDVVRRRNPSWWVTAVFWLLAGLVMADAFSVFLQNLANAESSGNASTVNRYGYLGLYQMGEAALVDAGYYSGDGTSANDWTGTWTGKDGIRSVQDFLSDPDAQTRAITAYDAVLWNQIEAKGLDRYLGSSYNGATITPSGLLAAAHLLGAGGLSRCLNGSGSCSDGFGTVVSTYLEKFAGLDVSSITGPNVAHHAVPVQPGGGTKPNGTVVNGNLLADSVAAVAPGTAFQSGSGHSAAAVQGTALAFLGLFLFTWVAWVALFQFKGWRDGRLTGMDLQVNVLRSAVVMMVVLGIVLL